MRALVLCFALFLAAPSAALADGFREAEVRSALEAAGFAGQIAAAARPAVTIDLA